MFLINVSGIIIIKSQVEFRKKEKKKKCQGNNNLKSLKVTGNVLLLKNLQYIYNKCLFLLNINRRKNKENEINSDVGFYLNND